MYKKWISCLLLLSIFLSVFVFCQVGYSSDTLTSDDLPGVGESLVISSDSALTIGVDESVVVDEAVLQINGTENTVTDFLIINNGEFTIRTLQSDVTMPTLQYKTKEQ